MEFKKN